MKITNILGTNDFIESLRGKKANFILALCNAKTYEIQGITQAGIPSKIHLTPTLDSEFVCTGQIRSLKNIATTPKGVPSPALITRAVHILKPFSSIELLNLGLEVLPKIEYFKIHDFDLQASKAINTNAEIKAFEVFQKALDFGKNYEACASEDKYIILAESVPSGTTSAKASALALDYEVKNLFSSSFKEEKNDIKNQTIKEALKHINKDMDIFEKLSCVSDNMLIFYAGFILGLSSKEHKIILAGGTQMACVLLIINSIMNTMQGEFNSKNIALCTTKWILEDKNSDIKKLLEMCDFKINAYASDFDFSNSTHKALKMYDEGEAKEGVGAGASLCYATINNIKQKDIIEQIESFLSL